MSIKQKRQLVDFHLVCRINGSPAVWLAQLRERRTAEQDVTGSNPGRTNTQGL